MSEFDLLTANVITWAEDRNIFLGSDVKAQMLKLTEEFGELASAIAKDDEDEIVDALGDMLVVMTILSEFYRTDLKTCFRAAWDEIKHRKGRMQNGVFVKEAAL